MNWLERKFWLWWLYKRPIVWSVFGHEGHEGGKLFWFYPFGISIRCRKMPYNYLSIQLSGGLTQRALDWLSRIPFLSEWAQNANQNDNRP